MRAGPASRDEFYLAFIVCLHHVITTIKKSILANRTGVFIILFIFLFSKTKITLTHSNKKKNLKTGTKNKHSKDRTEQHIIVFI